MSSTNKTSNLKLNSWIGSDKPQRTDFNYDNEVIDKTLSEHMNDDISHTSADEKERWNNYIYSNTYYGDGSISRVINTGCPFPATFGVVFAGNRPSSVVKFSSSQKVNYIGFFSLEANTSGLKLDDEQVNLTVYQTSQAIMENEYMNFNELGVAYHYIMFR